MKQGGSLRRAQRSAMRKSQILKAAAQVFAEKGYHNASTKDVAITAQVAEGTIYNYFTNKYELLLALVDQLALSQSIIETIPDTQDLRTLVSEQLKARLRITQKDPNIFQAVVPEILNTPELRSKCNRDLLQPLLGIVEKQLQTRVEQGVGNTTNVPLVARCIVGMIGSFYLLAILGDPVVISAWNDPNQFVDQLVDVIFDGLG